ncbi:MAG: response regulator [Lachnospiraceae bacterium]|jgi:two-component system response regulator YesN|nr:response regulator [Lachnospiraceae bacterium]
MELYKIMIVDDEEEVRKAIVKKMDWESLGFEVVADAENGMEALEKAETLELDVILTDIKMPFMDGLELGRILQEKHSPIKLILFSGFDEFEYAKEAIRLNVMEYVLKPVNAEELCGVLTRVKEELDADIAQSRSMERLKRDYEEMLPVIRERFLTDFVRGFFDREHAERRMDELEIPGREKPVHLAAAARVGRAPEGKQTAKDQEMLRISVRKFLEEQLLPDFVPVIWSYKAYLILIISMEEGQAAEGLLDILESVCRKCQRVFEVSLTVGVGGSGKGYQNIPESYREAVSALEYRAILGSGRVICYQDVDESVSVPVCFGAEEAALLTKAVTFGGGKEEPVKEAVEIILEKAENGDALARNDQLYMIGLLNTVAQIVEKYGLSMEQAVGRGGNYLELITAFQTTEELSGWLFDTAMNLSRSIEEKRTATTRNIVDVAREYIEKHYADPELSVDKLCRQIHLSPSYFSTIFKQETGSSYVNYLTEVRLQKAAALLQTTEDKTYLIASKVGYPEANYFSYVFKKRFGVSPTRFRNR